MMVNEIENNEQEVQSIENLVGYLINRTALIYKQSFLKELKESGLDITPEQWAILSKLNEKEGQFQRQIADELLKDKPNITRIIDILEKRNLVIRQSDKDDRRKFKILLTPEGKELVAKFTPITNKIKERVFRGVSEEEIENIKVTLNKLYNNLL